MIGNIYFTNINWDLFSANGLNGTQFVRLIQKGVLKQYGTKTEKEILPNHKVYNKVARLGSKSKNWKKIKSLVNRRLVGKRLIKRVKIK